MKKMMSRPSVVAAILIAAYLLGLIFGMFSIVLYPIYNRQKSDLFSRAEKIAEEYKQGQTDTIQFIKSFTTRILIYGANGECIEHVSLQAPHNESDDDTVIHTYLAPYQARVLNGRNVFDVAPSFQEDRDWNNFCLIAGVPIRDGEHIIGTVFLIRFLEYVQESYTGYLVYFTILYWIAAYCVITYSRKVRQLAELERNYIANVTHALKSPIASVKAIAETLSDVPDLDPDKRIFYYGMLLREANAQNHMVQEILELAKLQSHGMNFDKASVAASQVFEPPLEKFSLLCGCAQISLHISDGMKRLPTLYTDAHCIRQVIEILLENAVKYVTSGHNIWIDAKQEKNYAVFSVRDDGYGISPEDLPHVFDRFFRCNRNANDSSGLGLTIAKEIISGLKERIWVESQLGKGTTFYFTVRLN